MSPRARSRVASALATVLLVPSAWAQPVEPRVALAVKARRPLRIALERLVTVKQAGQRVDGTLVEPVYAYDRIVLPAGTKAIGRVEAIERAPRGARTRAILSGDLTPPRRVLLRFDALVLSDGRTIPIQTSATDGTERVVLRVAEAPAKKSIASTARDEMIRESKQAASMVTAPGKAERLKVAVIRALPYHPRLLPKGTLYTARLMAPIEFGSAAPARPAPAGALPAPGSILRGQLATPIGSATSAPGTRIEAALTQPVFAADGRLILPEGTRLTGEVTVARPARRFHRHGQLRFLFERVQSSDGIQAPLRASLHAVESSQRDRVSVDEEGGATSSSPAVRFAAPALAALALAGALHGRLDYDTDGLGPEMQHGDGASGALGGFLGLGLVGIGVNQFGRYVTVVTAAFALTKTIYSTLFAKGRDISFPTDTSIEVQLAAGRSSTDIRQEPRQ